MVATNRNDHNGIDLIFSGSGKHQQNAHRRRFIVSVAFTLLRQWAAKCTRLLLPESVQRTPYDRPNENDQI
jgi:hypothetical protein